MTSAYATLHHRPQGDTGRSTGTTVLGFVGALLLTLLLAFVAPASAAGAIPYKGAQMHPLWGSVEDFDRELDMAKAAGVTVVRADMAWITLEEAGPGRYSDWYVRKADTFFEHARDRGIKVTVDFWGSPCWASSAPTSLKDGCSSGWFERGVGSYAPNDPDDYARAAAWVARRWGSYMAALEVWNEPNIRDFMRNSDPERHYAGILKASYPRIKEAAPDLKVLGGALAGGDETFLRRLYGYGIAGHHDGLSIHPYDAADPSLRPGGRFLTAVPRMRDIMVEKGEGSLGLWLTELGWSTCTADSRCVPTEERQAEYTEAVAKAAEQYSYVKALVYYNLRDKGFDRRDFEQNYGLVRRDFQPKPGYTAMKRVMDAPSPTPAPVPAPAPEPEVSGTEWLQNTGLDSSTKGWSPGKNTELLWTRSVFYSGGGAGRVRRLNYFGDTDIAQRVTPRSPSGKRFHASFRIRPTADGRTARVRTQYLASDLSVLATNEQPAVRVSRGSWNKVEYTLPTAPAGTAHIRYRADMPGMHTNEIFYVDDLHLTDVATDSVGASEGSGSHLAAKYLRDDVLPVKVRCSERTRCDGRVALVRKRDPNRASESLRARTMGTRSFGLSPGRVMTLRVPVSTTARRLLAEDGHAVARLHRARNGRVVARSGHFRLMPAR